jgi:Flp pilus assembly protein TadD
MPWAAEPWQLLGEAELAAGHLDRARQHIRRATREDPGSWSAWLALAQAAEGPERRLALGRARALNPLAPEIGAIADNP